MPPKQGQMAIFWKMLASLEFRYKICFLGYIAYT